MSNKRVVPFSPRSLTKRGKYVLGTGAVAGGAVLSYQAAKQILESAQAVKKIFNSKADSKQRMKKGSKALSIIPNRRANKVVAKSSRGSRSNNLGGKGDGPMSKAYSGTDKKRADLQSKGILLTKELGISGTATDCLYIGHSTFAKSQWAYCLAGILVKKIFALKKIPLRNLGDSVTVQLNDQIGLRYKPNVGNTTATTSTVIYTGTGAGVTFMTIVELFYDLFYTTWTDENVILHEIFYGDAITQKNEFINLTNCKVDVWVKSSLKMQNSSYGTLGDEADDVDNVPIIGKCYEGNGNGTVSNRDPQTEKSFFAQDNCGYIQRSGTIADGLAELPPAKYFRSVKKVGKVNVDPGVVKYSTLSFQKKFNISDLLQEIVSITGPATPYKTKSKVGSFKFYGFEHVLQATSSAGSIRVAGEINYEIGMAMTIKLDNVTDRKVFSHEYVVY